VPLQAETTVSRLRTIGVHGSSPIDLVAVAFSRREEDAIAGEEMAHKVLRRFGQIGKVADISPDQIKADTGLEGFEALRCLALMELGRRAAGAGKGEVLNVDDPDSVADQFRELMRETREHFCALFLDAKNQLIRKHTIHIGTLTMSVVGPREVFREAIREGASSLVVVHNHPSGDPTPSPEDIQVTERLAEVGKMLDIFLLDHVIIGHRRNKSLRQMGVIK
jgi:DNA repair protein RadC